MRTSILYILILTGGIAASGTARAQPTPADADYVEFWLRSQIRAWQDVDHIEFRERSSRTVDNPFGVNTARIVAEITGYPDDREYDRRIISAELNGRRVPERRLDEFRDRWQQFSSQLGRESSALMEWKLRVLRQMRPTGRPRPDRYDDRTSFRIDLVTRVRSDAIDRITLWFAADSGQLLGSRVVFRPKPRRTSLAIETRHARIDGLDVPVRRSVEGTVQSKRRLRHFTTLVSLDTSYEDFRIRRRDR